MDDFGDRYLTRIYTENELADCMPNEATAASRLAARFAAKEAAAKALRIGDEVIDWRSVEVVRGADGAPELVLHDAVARRASHGGVTAMSVSLTHEGEYAGAVVVALALSKLEQDQ
jgi:holo-[acyl-carrier protein] synthase